MGKVLVDNKSQLRLAYQTPYGRMFLGSIESALDSSLSTELTGKVNLIFTSPPFPLVRKKRYGNLSGDEYLVWLRSLAPRLTRLLAPDGSVVIEVGNSWEEGIPEMSTLPLRALLAFQEAGALHLCQHVICHNPARLPSPAQWVNVRRLRLKDSFTHVWWLSPTPWPKADNRRVLLPYGRDMQKLLETRRYNAGKRPSGHVISESGFLTNHGGSIPSDVLEHETEHQRVPTSLLRFSNTAYDNQYRNFCISRNLEPHPARMQVDLVAFFVQFLTEPGDIVLDPFAGSNTTGAVAERMSRRWIGVEADEGYVHGSTGRFDAFEYRRRFRKGGTHG